jgi:hypothetical protein
MRPRNPERYLPSFTLVLTGPQYSSRQAAHHPPCIRPYTERKYITHNDLMVCFNLTISFMSITSLSVLSTIGMRASSRARRVTVYRHLSKWLTHLQVSTDLVDRAVVIHEHYAHENSSARDQEGLVSNTSDIDVDGQGVRR